jgi:hypothetical protein
MVPCDTLTLKTSAPDFGCGHLAQAALVTDEPRHKMLRSGPANAPTDCGVGWRGKIRPSIS